ncbi:macrolide family glycosyltransferase [Streptomyces cupreus]|uniref:Glycosyltransferase n=1 Tax=Streptomyces cupreus TaxID=2759956 RepID=A0A7X1J1M2_9ACTN|nr:macrolide family glycosyltransferase [Streptomyces cupreus]MBC2901984.1 glycosyltransferase [Streptomyces cupreus]
MSHIAFFNIPGTGHVNPTAGIVAELVARGHRVSYAVTARQGAEVEEAGATLVPYETTMRQTRNAMNDLESVDRFTTGDFVQVLRGLVTETEAVYPALDRAFADGRPDVLIHDGLSGWTGRLLAHSWGIPSVRSIPTLAANEHWSLGTDGEYATFEPEHAGLNAVYGEIAAMLDRLGVGLSAQEFFGASESGPALVFIPREFQFKGETFGEDFHFVGPCWSERRFDGEWSGSGERPLVLVSLGTIHNDDLGFFQTCVDAFAGLAWDVVMAVGDRVDPGRLSGVPGHVEVRAHVPQLQVLREADLFVTHAGMGSVMESLSFGVPMVAIPQMSEQRANADRLAELGLGVMLHRTEVTVESLREAVVTVLGEPSYAQRVQAMREHIRQAGGAPAAADVIESLLVRAGVGR